MSRSVLLVDDDESQRISLGILLEDEGFRVDVAASSARARALLDAADAAYDVVLLDMHLGDGLGSALLPRVRERLPRAVTLLISGSLTDHDVASAGFDGLIVKGTAFPDVLAQVEEALAHPARAAG